MAAGQLRIQFEDRQQQTHAAELGMWAFMASEVLFFSGLFTLFAAYRLEYGDAFLHARRTPDLWLGTANTFILLSSSLLVVLSIHGVRHRWRPASVVGLLGGTIALGVLFLGLKLLEYLHHFREGLYPGPFYSNREIPGRGAHMFFNLYYAMTGLHAVHVVIGLGMMVWLIVLVRRGTLDAEYHTPLELCGIYWHFVDIVWVFLWPLFYLLRA